MMSFWPIRVKRVDQLNADKNMWVKNIRRIIYPIKIARGGSRRRAILSYNIPPGNIKNADQISGARNKYLFRWLERQNEIQNYIPELYATHFFNLRLAKRCSTNFHFFSFQAVISNLTKSSYGINNSILIYFSSMKKCR